MVVFIKVCNDNSKSINCLYNTIYWYGNDLISSERITTIALLWKDIAYVDAVQNNLKNYKSNIILYGG